MPTKKTLSLILLCISFSSLFAQNKYNSLLWEISGKGLKKPSYIYGTMHVSNKLAFRLGDPFYKAIAASDVVATELDPDVWFESFITSEDYKLSISSSKSNQQDEGMALNNDRAVLIKNAFEQDLSAINNLMYRISATQANFEESTFLDLYIYKCGKKLNKKIAGVETYQQLMNAMAEASKADVNDREDEVSINPKDKASTWSNGEKIEEAYRRANLDLLDSLSHIGMSKREAECIIYKRNIIMGKFIDSIVKNQRLFIGVGAAHLPGQKGIIEWLRKKGYTVKPLDMGERDGMQRSDLDSLIYPQPSATYWASDSFYSVSVPGRMLDMVSHSSVHFATAVDMVNGAYYTVCRTLSSSFITNESPEHVLSSIDSSLYEIVPGDIITKKQIERFGYKGYDIVNRTRRGDLQRAQLFVTPNEILLFKLNGTDNFASSPEADKFFNSITIVPQPAGKWKTFSDPDHTFSINAPANCILYYSSALDNLDDRHLMIGSDQIGNGYFVLKHSYSVTNYIERDSNEMVDILESFAKKAKFKLDTQTYTIRHGRPMIDARYTTPDKRHIRVRTVLNQLDYYLIGVYYDTDTSAITPFFESFAVHNRPYNSFTWYIDTSLLFKVKLPYVPRESALSSMYLGVNKYKKSDDEEKVKTFSNPGYDEEIHVSFIKYDRYLSIPDTSFYKKAKQTLSLNYYQVLNNVKTEKLKDGWQIDALVSDTGSTQIIHKRFILKNGTRYIIEAYVDTLLGESEFAKTFFETFTPKDTVIGFSPLTNKGALYLKDLYSSDTAIQNKAIAYQGYIRFAKSDVDPYIKAVKNLPVIDEYKDYVNLKMNLLENFAVSTDQRVLDFLRTEYDRYSDTAIYQYAILKALTNMQSPAAMPVFRDLITSDQPLGEDYHTGRIFAPLIDSPELAKDYFTDLYGLSSIEDYKPFIIRLMAALHDKKLLKPEQYKDNIPMLLTEARNEYKRERQNGGNSWSREEEDNALGLLDCYNKLLIPFAETNSGVKSYFDKILKQGEDDMKIDLLAAMLSKGKHVPDSIITHLAANQMKRVALYRAMVQDSVENKFPMRYRDPDSFAISLVMLAYIGRNATNEERAKDTFLLIDKKEMQMLDEHGMMYFYKVKAGKDKFWKTETVGLQPLDKNKPLHTFNELYTSENYYLDNTKTIRDQFDETLDKLIKNKIRYQNPYYKRYDDFTLSYYTNFSQYNSNY